MQKEEAMRRGAVLVVLVALLLGGAAFGIKTAVDAKRPKGNDEDQLRLMLYEAERAAERRDAGGITRFISEDYQDSLGMSDSSLGYQIRDFFRRRRAVDVNIPSQAVRVRIDPGGRTGQVQFQLAMSAETPAGQIMRGIEMTLQVKKEPVHYYGVFPGEEWRVTSAEGYAGIE